MNEGKGPDERGVHQAEYRSVRADAEGKYGHGYESEAGRFAQRPRSIGGILPESGHAPLTIRRRPWLALSHSEARAPG